MLIFTKPCGIMSVRICKGRVSALKLEGGFMNKYSKVNVLKLAYIALFTAIVVVLQFLGGFIRFGNFSVTLVLLPIVIGSALCGWATGAWLGAVFGIMVFVTGDATLFLSINPAGTIVTVMVKGILAGLCAGLIYKLFEKVNRYLAVMISATVAPMVNTFIFLVGCNLFFYDTVSTWAFAEGMPVGSYLILIMVGANFLFELLFNIVLAPIAVRLLDMKRREAK